MEDVPLDQGRRRPSAWISATTAAACSLRSRSLTATSAPARANSRAHPRPIPRAAPVTNAVLPRRFMRFEAPSKSPQFGEQDSPRGIAWQVTSPIDAG